MKSENENHITEKEAAILAKKSVAEIWAVAFIIIVFIICMTLVYLNSHAWTIRFEMDNNTLEAVKSLNWTKIMPEENEFWVKNANCHTVIYQYDYENNTFYFVQLSDYIINIEGYNNEVYRIGNNEYKFVKECIPPFSYVNYTKPPKVFQNYSK